MTDTTLPAAAAPASAAMPIAPATSALKSIGSALLRTQVESFDSKRSMTGFVAALAAVLALIAGRQGWSWLTPELADKVAGVIVIKGFAVIAAHTFGPPVSTPAVSTSATVKS